MFKENVKLALEHNCQQLGLHVLEWNEPARNFYKKLSAIDVTSCENGMQYYRFTQEARTKFIEQQ